MKNLGIKERNFNEKLEYDECNILMKKVDEIIDYIRDTKFSIEMNINDETEIEHNKEKYTVREVTCYDQDGISMGHLPHKIKDSKTIIVYPGGSLLNVTVNILLW
jgi:hypothetical protein